MFTHRLLLVIFVVLFSSLVNAGVTIEKSRIIFLQDSFRKEVNIINHNDYSVMVRVWVGDSVDSTASNTNAKLLIDKPLFEMKPMSIERIGLINIDQEKTLNREVETIHYLNVEEQGKLTADFESSNAIAISMQTQYKIFIRPVVLNESNESSEKILDIMLTEKQGVNYLLLNNNAPYYVTVVDFQFIFKDNACSAGALLFDTMLKPKEIREVELNPELDKNCVKGIQYLKIDDDGAYGKNVVNF